MNCVECDIILAKIRLIDTQVKDAKEIYDYYQYRHGYSLIFGAHKTAIDVLQLNVEDYFIEWIDLKSKQIEIHKELTKHYRDVHLNVRSL